LLGHIFCQLRQGHLASKTGIIEGEYDLLSASISNGCDYRCQRDDPRWQVISTQEGVHQRRFASTESPNNHQVESVFSQAREEVATRGLQDFIFCIDGLRGPDDVGYCEFLLLVTFEIHEGRLPLAIRLYIRRMAGRQDAGLKYSNQCVLIVCGDWHQANLLNGVAERIGVFLE
jgi:hypothetical protein